LLSIPDPLASALGAGATLVVPSRQRAAAVRLAVAAAARGRGLRVWPTPDVLPWQGWLTREFEQRRHALGGARRLLRATEAWFIWRGIATALAEEHGLLSAAGLAAALPRSLARARDWGVRWSGDAGPEANVLRAAERDWRRACQALDAVDAADWSALPDALGGAPGASTAPVSLAGFATVGTARRAWLAARGVALAGPAAVAGAPLVAHAAADPAEELQAAAAWCRARLAADPGARLLVVTPDLERQRARLQRLFSAALEPAGAATAAANFAIEGGQPLADFPLVRAALGLLASDMRPLSFADFSAVLRSPYLTLGPPDAAARLDLWLRDRGLEQIDAASLRALLPLLTRELGAAAAAVVQQLLMGLPGGAADVAGGWARRWAQRLESVGWPGSAPLGSDELQVRRRFGELLGEYAASGDVVARRGGDAALPLLEALARETAYEPATDDVPVTVSGRIEDPLVGYDGIWVCGCDASRLPAAPAPDAFLPTSVQLGALMPEASAEGQLAIARTQLAAWRAATGQLVLSWARSDEDAEQGPSGLLAGAAPWDGAPAGVVVVVPATLETLPDDAGPAWPRGRRLGGGVQALQWQAECPFRAFAQLRLGAQPLPEPAGGVDPRLRGRVLHRALDALWGGLGDSATLQALSAAQQAGRVAAAVREALEHELQAGATPLPALLQAAELRRAAIVIGALLDAERERAPFRVLATEVQRPLELGELGLRLRIDRVDALADGRVAILDYKTGRAEAFDPHAARLRRPQLPGYALAWGEAVAALATVHLRRDGVKWRGVAAADGRLPLPRAAVVDAAQWAALREHWRAALTALLGELAAGVAPVAPLAGACEHCHLAPLCRVEADGAGPEAGDAAGGEGDDE
jgi:probable DNA repair protein